MKGTHNLNVTLKGYPKIFWGLFGQKAHRTQQITLFHPQRRFILNPNKQRTDLQPQMQTQAVNQQNSEVKLRWSCTQCVQHSKLF